MLKSQKLQVEASEIRSRLGTYLEQDNLGDEERSAMDRDTKRLGQLEIELRAALSIEGELETRALESTPDSEMRERLELRSTASLTNYLKGALSGRLPSGAEAELNAAAGIGDGIPWSFGIPGLSGMAWKPGLMLPPAHPAPSASTWTLSGRPYSPMPCCPC